MRWWRTQNIPPPLQIQYYRHVKNNHHQVYTAPESYKVPPLVSAVREGGVIDVADSDSIPQPQQKISPTTPGLIKFMSLHQITHPK